MAFSVSTRGGREVFTYNTTPKAMWYRKDGGLTVAFQNYTQRFSKYVAPVVTIK